MTDIDFDANSEFVFQGNELISKNNDASFRLNAVYFQYTRAYKVEVQLWASEGQLLAMSDLLLWPNGYFEIKPNIVRLEDAAKPAIFQFYANPYFMGLGKGKFEPRVYISSNISKVIVKKLLVFRQDISCKYALFLIRRAKDMLDIATEKYQGSVYDLCMHFSRYCIELSLKSVFPMFDLVLPREHDVSLQFSQHLREKIEQKSKTFFAALPRLLWISQQHISPDRLDLYGDPNSRTPPDLFVTANEAKIALDNAVQCYQRCCELFDEVMVTKE
jgi:HEPN domain-containing protein